MGNHKSLYKVYFNEVYMKRNEDPRRPTTRAQTGVDNQMMLTYQTHSSSGSSRQTPESIMGLSQQSYQPYYKNAQATGRATAELPTSASRFSNYPHSSRSHKSVKVIIDSNYSFIISIPDRLPHTTEDEQSCGIPGEAPNCAWLLEQVQKRYAQLLKEHRQNIQSKTKLKKKLIVALKTADKNENIDFWLTQYQRTLKSVPNNLVLEPHFSKIVTNKPKAVCSNDFELLKVIGKGGFSKVYMVRKKDSGLVYAMKVMKKDQVTNESKLKQIMNERTIMEQLADFPFVIKLHYAFQSVNSTIAQLSLTQKENLHFIIDFCTGGEMFYHLQKEGKFPEFKAKFYFSEILLGLEYLHSLNIVYRDMKPENVLIDVDGHIKLADFGLSKIFKRDERSFSFCGSPEYMCPEILKREGHNHMVDYYTLGAILYEMLVGIPPYYTNNKSEMAKRIIDSELTFPTFLNPDVVTLMRGLLERNPNKRLGSQRGIAEIKEHPWCADIDWNTVYNKKICPPWKPKLDQSNLDPEYTQLPLNFDESNFKRALQGDREFSFYLESPCTSLTVTEHSIYASNPDLTNTTNVELLLQSGSSKQLLEHFFNYQPAASFVRSEKQSSFILSPTQYQDIFTQQRIKLQMNTDMALKINQHLIRDESKMNLEYNQESGLTNFRGFSFHGENNDEKEVKRQLIKYTKLRNRLNKRLKQIQEEEGVIKAKRLKDIDLSSPGSSLSSIAATTVLRTPPILEDNSSRNSIPSQYQRVGTGFGQTESFNTSGLSQPVYGGGTQRHIDKKSKQQMIMARLGEHKADRPLFKSFQPEQNKVVPSAGTKNSELFRSNIESTGQGLLVGQAVAISHNEYLNDSIKSISSESKSVAEERDSFDENATVHQTLPNTHQKMNSRTKQSAEEESKENSNANLSYDYNLQEESKDSIQEDMRTLTPAELDPNMVKFILFQSQNVAKSKTTKIDKLAAKQTTKIAAKLIVNQRSRMANKKEESQTKDVSSLSMSGNSKMIQLKKTSGSMHQNSSGSQVMTNSRDNHINETDQKSINEKTIGTDYISTKNTFDHQSTKKTDDMQGSYYESKDKHIDMSSDLDKTANIMAMQQQYQTQSSAIKSKTKKLSPGKAHPVDKSQKKPKTAFKKKNLEIDIHSPRDLSKRISKRVSIADPNEFQPPPPHNLNTEDEFIISRMKKQPQTEKHGDSKKGGSNFSFEGIIDQEKFNEAPFVQMTPRTQGQNILSNMALMKKAKKLSHHSKQVSSDFVSQEFYAQVRDKLEASNASHSRFMRNEDDRSQSQNTSNLQEQSSPELTQKKISQNTHDEVDSTLADQVYDIQSLKTNQLVKKDSTSTAAKTYGKKAGGSATTGVTRPQGATLRKGITITASTIGLGKTNESQQHLVTTTLSSGTSGVNLQSSFKAGKNKPPLNSKLTELVGKKPVGTTSQIGQPGGKQVLGSTLGTPSGIKKVQLSFGVPAGTQQKANATSMSVQSQPSSTKNTHSQKFQFPANSAIDQVQSPSKKNQNAAALPVAFSGASGAAAAGSRSTNLQHSSTFVPNVKSMKSKATNPRESHQVTGTSTHQVQLQQEETSQELSNSQHHAQHVQLNLEGIEKCEPAQASNRGYLSSALQAFLKPAKTTTNAQAKGFFQ